MLICMYIHHTDICKIIIASSTNLYLPLYTITGNLVCLLILIIRIYKISCHLYALYIYMYKGIAITCIITCNVYADELIAQGLIKN